ncbi:MAG: hypothetical protein OQL17_10625 [Sedimenticola sp.]|nr:hypothetical protein [Sedimenticola sp.]
MSRELRQRIAVSAAQLIAESGDLSYSKAREKAAKHLGCNDRRQLPENSEIEAALHEHLQLFKSPERISYLNDLRNNALSAMRSFDQFQPHLIGPILTGTASVNTPISLILFADTVEAVVMELMERKIPWRQKDISVDYSKQKRVRRSLLTFFAGDIQVELLILPLTDQHNLPLDPIQGRPQKGASISKVQAMIEPD